MKKLYFLFAIISLAVLAACSSMPKDSEAFIISKQIAEAQVNQANMKFPFAEYRHDITSDSLYTIESHFDSNNQRINYRVKMYYRGGDWSKLTSWEIKDFQTW